MRLGGYVIHGDAAATLAPCLESLRAVCDEVVAVDSGSSDGSADLVRASGARAVLHPWEGFGAARAAAVAALGPCDYVLFLDSDEHLGAAAIARLRAWRGEAPGAPGYALLRRNWATLDGRTFLFETERHACLVRRDAAAWEPSMVIHERLPGLRPAPLDAVVEHRFASSLEALAAKRDRYALLWAVEAHARGKRPKRAGLQLAGHAARYAIVRGAAIRGGAAGARLAVEMARYHARKHELLAALRAGAHADAVAAYREARWRDLFRIVGALS